LIRAAVRNDPNQTELAMGELSVSDSVAVPLAAFCEFARVPSRAFKRRPKEIAASIRDLIASGNVVVDKLAVEAGLGLLDAGGEYLETSSRPDCECIWIEARSPSRFKLLESPA